MRQCAWPYTAARHGSCAVKSSPYRIQRDVLQMKRTTLGQDSHSQSVAPKKRSESADTTGATAAGPFADSPAMGGLITIVALFNSTRLRTLDIDLNDTIRERIAATFVREPDAELKRKAVRLATDVLHWMDGGFITCDDQRWDCEHAQRANWSSANMQRCKRRNVR